MLGFFVLLLEQVFFVAEMADPGRNTERKRPIDDIIDHITADLQGYDGQYHVLGQPLPSPTNSWPNQQTSIFLQNPQTQINLQVDQSHIKVSEINTYYYPTSQLSNSNNFIPFNGVNNNDNQFKSRPTTGIGSNQNINFPPYRQQEYGLFSDKQEEENRSPTSTSRQLIDHLVGNWMPNQTGTYSPFGSPAASPSPESKEIHDSLNQNSFGPSRAGINSTIKKPRMVAEVKPMRLSYSDVLTKSLPATASSPSTNGSSAKASSTTKSDNGSRSKAAKGKKGEKFCTLSI